MDGTPLTIRQVRAESWTSANAEFEVSIDQIRDKPLKRWCRHLVQLVREICCAAFLHLRVWRFMPLRQAQQLMAARDGVYLCERIRHRLARINWLTFTLP